jgi:hypothetical protein
MLKNKASIPASPTTSGPKRTFKRKDSSGSPWSAASATRWASINKSGKATRAAVVSAGKVHARKARASTSSSVPKLYQTLTLSLNATKAASSSTTSKSRTTPTGAGSKESALVLTALSSRSVCPFKT